MDDDRLATAIPEIYAIPQIGDRVALSIIDALICQYQGEETTLLHYSVPLNQLWFSKDPVALDVLGLQELGRQRKLAKIPEAKFNSQIYLNSAIMDIGIADPSRIQVERLELK
jgi:hypothetical protein